MADGLFSRLGWPAGRDLRVPELQRLLGELGRLAAERGAAELAELVDSVVRDPDSPDHLYKLGYALIDAGTPEVAATVLWHCLALVGDSEEVVCELVSALESALAHADAFDILDKHAALRARSYLPRYLYAYNAAMIGRLDVTRATLPSLAPDGSQTATLHGTIAGIVERADRVAGTCPLDTRDLRGWHYVLTGGLLVHQSPYGFDDPMHGRYAWLADSLPRLAYAIDQLGALVKKLALPCVYAPEGRDHEIVAEAIATRLGIPRAPWPAIGVPAPGLVALYDLRGLLPGQLAQLEQRRPDQILFAHASPWTVDSPIAPDVTTLLYQSIVPPWGESAVIDPATGEVSRAAADHREVSAIAAEVSASAPLPAGELSAEEPERWSSLVARAWPPSPGSRTRLWAGGPVPSSRFS
ncbi:MAG: hypothetical protein H0T46_08525 [Deltaproteobacteria bacterium]|nr:hypothetical protein [Deltaproteobacteria bacterium]